MLRDRRRIGGALALLALMTGCGRPKGETAGPTAPSFAGQTLVAAVVGDPAILPGLRAKQGEWAASSGAEVRFRDESADPKALEGIDVLVFPGGATGGLVDLGALLVLPEEALRPPAPPASEDGTTPEVPPDPFALNDIVATYRDDVTKYGPDRVGLPLGGTALVLAFNRAAFDRDDLRAAAGSAGIKLEPPRTWAELDALAKFFHGRDLDGDGKPDSGIVLGWADDAEGIGNAAFLARAASLGQHRDQYSFLFNSDRMAPRVASPPFVEALQGLVDLTKLAPPGASKFDAKAARDGFRSGKVALLIDRAERASTWSEGRPVGVAPLPGSERVYAPDRNAWEEQSPPNRPSYLPGGAGWLVGVSARSAHRDAAIDFARYLAGPDVTNRLRSDPAFPMLATRNTQIGQGLGDPRSAPGIEARGWSDAVGRTLGAARVVVGLRIPEADGYLADLARGRIAALEGQPAEAALKAVTSAWDARTDRLGRERQVWHYRRSLNRLETLPTPPPAGK